MRHSLSMLDQTRRISNVKAVASTFLALVGRAFVRDRVPLGIALAVWLICAWLLVQKGLQPVRIGSIQNNLTLYTYTIAGVLVAKMVAITVADRPEFPLRHIHQRLIEENWWERLASNIPMFLALAAFMPMFSAMKSAIPLFTEFDWDETFIAWDIALHGTDPWRLLQPIIGYPPVTFVLSSLYQIWLLLIYFGCVFFCLFVPDARLRLRYFTSYFLMWSILGIAGAQYFASIGPCFLLTLEGDPRFLELMGYLYTVDTDWPLVSLRVQEILIRAYHVENHELGSGITAMPSMHVALAFLFAIAIFKHRRVIGWIFGAYAVVILITSVHLGFHYAVDGYASILGVLVIWWLSGVLIRKEPRAPEANNG